MYQFSTVNSTNPPLPGHSSLMIALVSVNLKYPRKTALNARQGQRLNARLNRRVNHKTQTIQIIRLGRRSDQYLSTANNPASLNAQTGPVFLGPWQQEPSRRSGKLTPMRGRKPWPANAPRNIACALPLTPSLPTLA